MPSICSVVLAVCWVVSLSRAAGEQHAAAVLQNSRSRRQLIDENAWNGSLSFPEGFAEVRSIQLSTATPWPGDFSVNTTSNEMNIYFGKQLKDVMPTRELFEKYFGLVTPQTLNKTHEVPVYYKFIGNVTVLNVAPVQAGTSYIFYSGTAKNGTRSGRWTVHHVPTVTLRRGSFFRIPLHIVRVSVAESLYARDLNDIGVDVDPQRNLYLYGVASQELHDKVLNIKLMSADSASDTIKIHILTEERPAQHETHQIQLTVAANLTTLRSRIDLADCVASACNRDSSHLTGVVFKEISALETMFGAQLANVEDPQCFARIPFRIRNCSTVRVLDESIDAGRSQKAHLPSTTTQATTTTAQAKSRTSDDATVTELSTPEVALEEARTTNKTNSKQFVSYMTVRVHLQNYASAWLLIFVVLFLLIMILSR